MTIELYFFLILTLIGLSLCIREIKPDKLFSLISFILFFCYSIITRYAGFDVDMETYSLELKNNTYSFYYLREPIYWLTSRYLYKLTNSPEITFILLDALAIILIIKARSNLKLPQYFIFLYFLFFPSIMGMNNVYRQYLSYSFFIYFISLFYVQSSNLKKIIYLLLSILTHNSSALFSPLYFVLRSKSAPSIKSMVLSVSVVAALPLFLSTKSDLDTGLLRSEIYLLAILAFAIFYIYSYNFIINSTSGNFFYYFIFSIFLVSISIFLMGSGQSKRVGMFALIISLIPTTIAIETRYKQKKLMRCLIYILLVIPTVIFPSSLSMLLTNE